ncbi:MAG: AAA family ATPase [Prevotellaceae bacterium]|jgi:shikimate kinase|nr:AAA family ATPase [Prevotellaceae bacterium]
MENKNNKLILIYGAPCSGKTTLGQELSIKYNLNFISTDSVRKEIFKEKINFSSEENHIVFECFIKNIETSILEGESLLCEGLFISKYRRERLFSIMPNRINIIYLSASIETLKKRLEARKQNPIISEKHQIEKYLSEEELFDFYNRSMPPKDEKVIINTDNISEEEVLKKAINIISFEEHNKQTIQNIFLYD